MLCLKLTLLTLLIAATGLLVSGGPVITCDGDILYLGCASRFIHVLSTVFGRRNINICPPKNPNFRADTTNCKSDITSIAESCNGLHECEVNTLTLGNADPCPGIFKYYEITYECLDYQTAVVCESDSYTLDCGSDIIKVMDATFEVDQNNICTKANPNSMEMKSNICTMNVLSAVSALCDDESTCLLQATYPNNFNGPCKNAAKYLSVSYECIND